MLLIWGSVLFCSVTQSCPTLCDFMDCSMPGFPVYHWLPELTQTHVHEVGDAIQPSHPLSSPSPPAFNLSQHQSLSLWVSSLHQMAKVLEFQLQHQSFSEYSGLISFRMDWFQIGKGVCQVLSPCLFNFYQFSLVHQSCPTLWPMDCRMPGFPVHHQLPEHAQTHVHEVGDAIQTSYPLLSPSLPSFNLSQHQGLFQWVSSLHGGQSIGALASASVLPMNIQEWFPLGWTGWISVQSKGLSRVFSNTTVQKHQFFGAQLSLQSNFHIHTWPLEKP